MGLSRLLLAFQKVQIDGPPSEVFNPYIRDFFDRGRRGGRQAELPRWLREGEDV